MLKTIVEDYISAALEHAVVAKDDAGFVSAYVEGFPGVRAHGDDSHACYRALWDQLESWVKAWLDGGYDLPAFNGIDLNTAGAQVLASYHDHRKPDVGLQELNLSGDAFLSSLDEILAV